MTEGIKRVTVGPGISPEEMHVIWETAIEEAMSDPGSVVAVLFAPGEFPLPETGAYAYKDIPTSLRASSSVEVRFRYNARTGSVHITTVKENIHDDGTAA